MAKKNTLKASFFINIFCCFLFMSLLPQLVLAEFDITTESTNDIAVCKGGELLNINLQSLESTDVDFSVFIDFPAGIYYESSSLDIIDIPAGLSMSEQDISDLNHIELLVTIDDGSSFDLGDEIVFELLRNAGCEAVDFAQNGGVFEDIIEVAYDSGNVSGIGSPYSVIYGALSILQPSTVETFFDEASIVEVSLVNGGIGCVDSAMYYQIFDSNRLSIDDVSLDGLVISYEISGDTLWVPITAPVLSNVGNGDACLDDGETVLLNIDVKSIQCEAASLELDHKVEWGCEQASCNEFEGVNSNVFVYTYGIPNLQMHDLSYDQLGTCTEGNVAISIVNIGTNNANDPADALNIGLNAGWKVNGVESISGVAPHWGGVVSNVEIGGESIDMLDDTYISLEFNTNPDMGLYDLDGDGYYNDLPNGDSIVVSYDIDYSCQNNEMPVNYRLQSRFAFSYNNRCDLLIYSQGQNVGDNGHFFEHDYSVGVGPSDMWIDEPETFIFSASSRDDFVCENDLGELVLYVGPGINISEETPSAYLSNGVTFETIEEEGTIRVKGIEGEKMDSVHIDLVLTCADDLPGSTAIDWEYLYECETDCDCAEIYGEGRIDVYLHDMECYPEEAATFTGLLVLNMEAKRTTLGWTDHTLTEKIDPTSAGLRLDRAMPCDSIKITSDLKVGPGGDLDNATIKISHVSPLEEQIVLDWSAATIDFKDIETGDEYTCVVTEDALSWDLQSGIWYLSIELTSMLGDCFPEEVLSPNDELRFEGDFVVLDSPLMPTDFYFDVSPFRLYGYYHDDEADLDIETSVGYRIFVFDYDKETNVTNFGLQTCQENEKFNSLSLYIPTFDRIFPNEVRPYFHVDSIAVVLDNDIEYIDESARFYLDYDGTFQDIDNPIISSFNGEQDQLLFVNDDSWLINDFENALEIVYGRSLSLYLQMGVECVDNPLPTQFIYYITDRYYAGEGACEEPQMMIQALNTNYIGTPDPTALLANTYIEGLENQHEIVVSYCNEGQGVSTNSFLILDTQSEEVEIVASDIGVLNDFNGTQKILYLDDVGINTCITPTLTFEYSTCELIDIEVITGWDCESYPEVGEFSLCGVEQNYIEVDPKPSEVQLDINGPLEAVALCDTILYEFTINSAQLANITNPILSIDLPVLGGLSLATNPLIEYPLGSTDRTFTPIIENNTIIIDLGIADAANEPVGGIAEDGIKGVGTGSVEERKAVIKLPFITTCDFISGSRIQVNISADRPCGGEAIGSGITTNLEALTIIGAAPEYSTITSLGLGSINSCDNSVKVDVNIYNDGPLDFGEGDQCLIVLTEGMEYLENSTFSIGNIVAEPEVIENNGLIKLLFDLPIGVEEGEEVDFSMGLIVDDASFCDGANIELLAQTVQYFNLSCVADEEECNVSTRTSQSDINMSVELNSASLSIAPQDMLIQCAGNNWLLGVQFDITNESDWAYTADEIAVELHIDVNENGSLDEEDVFIDSLPFSDVLQSNESTTIGEVLVTDEFIEYPVLFTLDEATNCELCNNPIASFTQVVNSSSVSNIGGTVWNDFNGNGINDENGVINDFALSIDIYDENNELITTEESDGEGNFNFSSLPGGTYTVILDEESLPNGTLMTTVNTYIIQVDGCNEFEEVAFGLANCELEAAEVYLQCEEDKEDYYAYFVLENGVPPYQIEGTIEGETSDFVITIGPFQTGTTFDLAVTDANGCSFTYSDELDCVGTLPVELIAFTAKAVGEINHLQWFVASEIEADFYTLERSTDGVYFETITNIAAKGNEILNEYDYKDDEYLSAISYYRLLQTDQDGQVNDLGVKSIERKVADLEVVNIYPVPANDIVNVVVQTEIDANIQIDLYSIDGRLVKQSNVLANSMSLTHSMDISNINAGVYLMQVQQANQVITQKIIIE